MTCTGSNVVVMVVVDRSIITNLRPTYQWVVRVVVSSGNRCIAVWSELSFRLVVAGYSKGSILVLCLRFKVDLEVTRSRVGTMLQQRLAAETVCCGVLK